MNANSTTSVIPADQRRMVEAFANLDRLLTQVEYMILASRSHSPFNDYLNRLSDGGSKAVADALSELRTVMLCATREMAPHGVAEPRLNIVWTIRSTLANGARLLDEVAADARHPNVYLQIAGRRGDVERVDPVARMRQILADVEFRLATEG